VANPLDIIQAPTGAVVDTIDNVLNPDQKAKLSTILARNGWGTPNSELNRRARAVVKRESGGDPKAKNPSGATGLFQMMTPLHCGSYGIPKPVSECVTWLEDPDNNAKAAKALHATAGWQPWAASGGPPAPTTWDPEIVTDRDTLSGGVGEVAGQVTSPFTGIASAAIDLIGSLMSADTWFRIGKTWLGAVFVITGTGALVFIIANQASGGKVARAAKTAATRGVVS
jgi:hypothetical protein